MLLVYILFSLQIAAIGYRLLDLVIIIECSFEKCWGGGGASKFYIPYIHLNLILLYIFNKIQKHCYMCV